MQTPFSSVSPDEPTPDLNAPHEAARSDREQETFAVSPVEPNAAPIEVAFSETATSDNATSGAAPPETSILENAPFAPARQTPPPVAFEPMRVTPPANAASLQAPPVVSSTPNVSSGASRPIFDDIATPTTGDEPRGFAPLSAPTGFSPGAPRETKSIYSENLRAEVPRGNALGSLQTMLLGGVLACALVGLGTLIGRGGKPISSTGNGGASVDETSQSAIISAVQQVGPAVMNVDTTFGGNVGKEFLPDPSTLGRPVQGKGTGFVFDSKRGLMLTNAHVVADARKIQVTTRDGKKYTGKILGVDRQSDIAVVVLDNKSLPEAKLAPLKNARDVQIGQWSIAIGNPFAQANTVTVGVISAVGRTIPVPDEKNGGTFQLKDMIQTDAAINPGNSGGPLCNIKGEVVGINTAIYGIGTGLGFTIPINKAKAVADEIIKHGSVQRAYVGLQLQAITSATKTEYGLKDTLGALVQNTAAGSPSEKAGFQPGDIIRKIDGQSVKDVAQAQEIIQKQKVGVTLKVEILRNNTTPKTLNLKTAPQPNP